MNYAIIPTNQDIVHRSHKYIDRKKGKNGKWIYIYNRAKSKIGITQRDNMKKAHEYARKVDTDSAWKSYEKDEAAYKKTPLSKLETVSQVPGYLVRKGTDIITDLGLDNAVSNITYSGYEFLENIFDKKSSVSSLDIAKDASKLGYDWLRYKLGI